MAVMEDLRGANESGRVTSGLLVRLRPKRGHEAEVEELLDAVLRLSTREQHTETSLLMRFPDGEYALLDLFTDERSRREHLAGSARQAIAYRSRDLFDQEPVDHLIDVVGQHLPTVAGRSRLASGTWLTFAPDDGAAEDFSAHCVVSAANDSAWLAVQMATGDFAVVDLSVTHELPEPTRLPEVCCDGREVRLVSSERFRLLGPDVPDPTIIVPPRSVTTGSTAETV